MICPKCNENLPDDYFGGWCDGCGDFIYRCADETCAGYRILTLDPQNCCGRCGEPVVPNGPQGEEESAAAEPAVSVQPPTPAVNPQPVYVPTEGMEGAGSHLIFAHTNGWQIDLNDEDILGRVNGRFASQLGQFKFVSGTHAKITKKQDGWYITDQQSKNKTWVNDKEAQAFVPVLLKPNDLVTLASEKFVVIIS